jgi:hypothetical protein
MPLRAFYTIAILLPLAALAAVAALGGGEATLAPGLPAGLTAEWLYPRSAVREVVVYAGVAVWLLWELRGRRSAAFAQLLWRAPVVVAVASFLLPMPFALVTGSARELVTDQGAEMVLRLLVRLLVGFGYVALLVFIREQLRQGNALRDGD